MLDDEAPWMRFPPCSVSNPEQGSTEGKQVQGGIGLRIESVTSQEVGLLSVALAVLKHTERKTSPTLLA